MNENNTIPKVIIEDKKIEDYFEKFFRYITDKNLNLILERYGIIINNHFESQITDKSDKYKLVVETLSDIIKRYLEINHYSSDELAYKFGSLLAQMGIDTEETCVLCDIGQPKFDDISFKCHLQNSREFINIIMKLHGVNLKSHFMGFIELEYNGGKTKYKYESKDRFIDKDFDKKLSLTRVENENIKVRSKDYN